MGEKEKNAKEKEKKGWGRVKETWNMNLFGWGMEGGMGRYTGGRPGESRRTVRSSLKYNNCCFKEGPETEGWGSKRSEVKICGQNRG